MYWESWCNTHSTSGLHRQWVERTSASWLLGSVYDQGPATAPGGLSHWQAQEGPCGAPLQPSTQAPQASPRAPPPCTPAGLLCPRHRAGTASEPSPAPRRRPRTRANRPLRQRLFPCLDSGGMAGNLPGPWCSPPGTAGAEPDRPHHAGVHSSRPPRRPLTGA